MPKGFDYGEAYRRQDLRPRATSEQMTHFHEETLPRIIEDGLGSGEDQGMSAPPSFNTASRKEVGRDIFDTVLTADIENDVLISHGYEPKLSELGPQETFLDIIDAANEKRKD